MIRLPSVVISLILDGSEFQLVCWKQPPVEALHKETRLDAVSLSDFFAWRYLSAIPEYSA